MTPANLCRLCVNTCQGSKTLYDDNGQQNFLYDITRKYFHPKIVNLNEAKHIKTICLTCWRHISDFQSFQTLVEVAQLKFCLEERDNDADVEEIKTEVEHERKDCISPSEDIKEEDLILKTEEEFIALPEKEMCLEGSRPDLLENEVESLSSSDNGRKDSGIADADSYPVVDVSLNLNDNANIASSESDLIQNESGNKCITESVRRESIDSISEDDMPLSRFMTNVKAKVQLKTIKPKSQTSKDVCSENISERVSSHIPPKSHNTKTLGKIDCERNKNETQNLDHSIAECLPTIKCILCPEIYTKYSLYRQHFRLCHPFEKFQISCCNSKFYRPVQIKEHMLLHNDPNAFKCQLCGTCLSSNANLRGHISKQHPETLDLRYKCSKCDKAYTSERACNFHYTTQHCTVRQPKQVALPGGGSLFTCKECEYSTSSAHCFSQHRWYSHQLQPKHKCQVCGKMFKVARRLRNHACLPQRHTCIYCSKTFKTYTFLKIHKNRKHADKVKTMPSPSQGKDAKDQNKESYKLQIIEEPKTVPRRSYKKRHPPKSSSDKSKEIAKQKSVQQLDDLVAKWLPTVKCILCPESFTYLSLLQEHFRRHHAKKKLHISCCQSKLINHSNIEEHFQLHNDPDAFKCHVCGRHHKLKRYLMSHIARQHPETFATKYACTECPQSFVTERRLKLHYRATHEVAKQQLENRTMHPCKDCGKVFQKLRALNHHTWYHRNKLRHECMACGKSFKHHATLSIHMAIHKTQKSKEPQLKCPTCGKRFKEPLTLTKHLATHKRKGFYACPSCPMSFINLSNFELHCKIAHPQDDGEAQKNSS